MATDTHTGKTGAAGAGHTIRRLLLDNGALSALVVLLVAMSLLSGDFLTTQNLLNVGVQAAVTAILAFGVTFVIVSAGIDLSVGSVAALSATVLAWSATSAGVPVWLAVILAVATGIACGFVNGALVAYGKLPSFIATLAMLSVARGLSLVISQGSPIAFPDSVSVLGDTLGGWLPVPVLVMIAMGLLTALILARTYIGRSMYAIGGNEEAARLSGLRVNKQKLAIYALSGLFAAVAGIVLASRLVSAQPQAAQGYELDAIAAVVIGGASLAGGVGKASGTLIGALILAVLRNGLNLLSVSAFWQQVVIGVVIALAVLLDTLRRKAGPGGAASTGSGAPGAPGSGRKGAVKAGLAVVVVAAVVAAVSFFDSGSSGTTTKVGMSLSTLNNPFFVQMKEGAQAEAKKAGIDLTVTDAQNDASQQANQLQNFTSSGVDSVIVNPVDSDAVGPGVRSANKADIPVIAADRGVNKADTATLVASDNVAGGKLAAKALADKLGGKGSIVVLQGTAGTSASRERGAGFAEGIKAYPGIKVVATQPADFDRTKGLDVMTNLLQGHPGITGVFAENDEMALGAVKALGSKAGKSVSVVGFDGTPDGLKAVEAGTLYASVAQQPKELGRIAVQNAVKAADDEKIQDMVKVPVKVVTRENVADFS
ncbi:MULTISPECIES: substrate-binding domain-containing protein [unclassified Streptomyces]|uniref:ABC transporter permease/substrate-binding protein n=1 Tax=unclassified Streptomyces TaxID=2593676 RepID=UPI0001C1AC4B|nr:MULTISPECIES: substrate-binding domain-containing protein [unclassified Streptomyces]MYR65142.1 substrate-binding domain-containing protein [Streptomyces sp. SID4939]MYR99754.1 substrate-binding domain-containing protein [Streptomyces sp. SID4940]MYT67002.1 substrate-binding domain-containing protein [Streptomyces sp. SID8357]MYT84646.1 substrate-binding domain-containing protein [Streptomyces sp. SID8360]MYW41002.1 substrate-binding domain-containing protein [Streptomyces sp. SID1]MYX7409